MGFYIRKSVRVGLVRFNLSKSGIGVSAGVRGLRIGSGPRGTYVHAGRGGLYYRSHLFSASRETPRDPVPVRPSAPSQLVDDGLTEIRSASADTIRDESSDSVLSEIRARRAMVAFTPLTAWGFIAVAVVWAVVGWPAWVLVPIAALPALIWAHLRDQAFRTTLLMYDLEPDALAAVTDFHDAFTRMAACDRVWNVDASGANADYKYHAGATQLQRRSGVKVTFGQPPGIKTNVPVPSLSLGAQTLYFFPERIFVYGSSGVGAVTYSQLECRASTTRFIEEEHVPRDARLVDHTWRYVNKNGLPDRRFARNPQLPILSYGELFLASPSGLRAYLQTSQEGIPDALARALTRMRNMNAASPEMPAIR